MNLTRLRSMLSAVVLGSVLFANSPRINAEAVFYTQAGLNPTGNASEGTVYEFGTDSAIATLHYEYTAAGASVVSIYDGSAEARASFGELGVKAAATLTDYRPGTYQIDETSPIPFPAYAMAGFTDSLTVEGGSGNGLLTFSFSITGTVANGPFMGNDAIATLKVGGNSVQLTPGYYTSDSVAVSDPVPFTFGTPLNIRVEFLGNVFVSDLFADNPYSTSGDASFLSTLVLSGIRPTDIAGNTLAGVTIASESGTAYPVNAVPEPNSLVLLATAAPLVAACWSVRHRRRRNSGNELESRVETGANRCR